MTFKKLSSFGLLTGLALALPALGCPADDEPKGDDGADDGNTTAADDDGNTAPGDDGMTDGPDDGMTDGPDDDADSATTDGPMACPGDAGAGAVGDACTANSDCASGLCELFADAPPPTDAVCGEQPADCATRVTGTIFDFTAGAPVGGAMVRVAPAIQAATNPAGAPPLIEGTSGADGVLDAVSDGPVTAALGIVALVEAEGYFLTATGLAGPDDDGAYKVGTNIHDIWAVPTTSLDAWSAALAMDTEVPEDSLPLGEMGGVIGLVRDAATGDPIPGATVVSETRDSDAIVRYLADDDSWTVDGTAAAGVFTIINPSLAESFHVEIDGATVGNPGTAGSALGAIFTLVINVPPS